MQCGDLERYLEAFLDGRLGRSRSAILRRHLALCGACQARVERLRQFERETQRRFRALEPAGSVWNGLELDLVASSRAGAASRLLALPRPAAPAHQLGLGEERAPAGRDTGHPMLAARAASRPRAASRFAGALMVAMALGALYQLARAYLLPADESGAAAQAYLEFVQESRFPVLRSDDATRLQEWLAAELRADGVPALPTPDGYHAVGVDRAALPSGAAGVVVYASGAAAAAAAPLLLFVQAVATPGGTAPAPALVGSADLAGVHELSWSAEGFRYTLVGRGPQEELARLVEQDLLPAVGQ